LVPMVFPSSLFPVWRNCGEEFVLGRKSAASSAPSRAIAPETSSARSMPETKARALRRAAPSSAVPGRPRLPEDALANELAAVADRPSGRGVRGTRTEDAAEDRGAEGAPVLLTAWRTAEPTPLRSSFSSTSAADAEEVTAMPTPDEHGHPTQQEDPTRARTRRRANEQSRRHENEAAAVATLAPTIARVAPWATPHDQTPTSERRRRPEPMGWCPVRPGSTGAL